MKTMPNNSLIESAPALAEDDPLVISYSNIPIIKSDLTLSDPCISNNIPDNIDLSHTSSTSLPFTKKSKQTTSYPALRIGLEYFLTGDVSTILLEFQKWSTWSINQGYAGSRIIKSGNALYLLATSKEGFMDIYALPYTRGGCRNPTLRKTFSDVQIGILHEMLQCRNVSNGHWYCGYCPSCLRFQTQRKLFVNKSSVVKRLESEKVELEELIKKGQRLVSSVKRRVSLSTKEGYVWLARMHSKHVKRLEGWVDDPKMHLLYRQLEIGRLTTSRQVVHDQSKLIQTPHWLISISCPMSLHNLFEGQDAWLPARHCHLGRGVSDGVQNILKSIANKDNGFEDLMRHVFKSLVVDTVQSQYPGLRLTMEYQMHPFNKIDGAPDMHFMVCSHTIDSSENLTEVLFDKQSLMTAYEKRMRIFAGFASWVVKHWSDGCRATAFKEWRRDLLKGVEQICQEGIPTATVDVRVVPVNELLSTHAYVRRQPMENVKSLYYNPETGVATVRYFGRSGHPAQIGIIELLWRFVGCDGRNYGVQYSGTYRSSRGMKRDRKVDAIYRAIEMKRELLLRTKDKQIE